MIRVDTIDWQKIQELRSLFCEEERAAERAVDYWQEDPELLQSYHLTLAERIGWKWDNVLAELVGRDFRPQVKEILDFGCGTGVQTLRVLRWLQAFNAEMPRVVLIDQSVAAVRFAAEQVRREFPGIELDCRGDLPVKFAGDMVICSHVINEIDASMLAKLSDVIRHVQTLIWVEAGAKNSSLRLGSVRAALGDTLSWVAPCPHQTTCPVLASPGDWCHFFAAPPTAAFTTAFWREFATVCQIDLRSLPTAFLVGSRTATELGERARVLGKVRNHKAGARVQTCSASGLSDVVIEKRKHKQLVKELKKNSFCVELP